MIEATGFALERTEPTQAAWWAVVSRFLLHGLIVSTWVSRIPAIQSSLGLTNASLGWCLMGTAAGSAVAIPATGWLVAKFGSKSVAAWSTAGFAVALLGPSLAGNAASLFASLTIFGALAGANDVSINAQGVAVEKAMESPTMSRFHAMFSIGGLVGATLGGLLAAHGISPRVHLSATSMVLLIASIVSAPFLLDAQDYATERQRTLRVRRIQPILITLACIGFCMFLSEGAMADWSGVYLKQVLHADHGLAAAAYAVFSCGMAAFRLLGDTITERLGPVRTVRLGALAAAAGLILALTATTAIGALPGFALTGAGFSVIVPLVFAASGRVSIGGSGAGIAIVSGAGYFGFLFGPPLIGLMAQATSLRIALFGIVLLSLVAAVLAKAAAVTRERVA